MYEHEAAHVRLGIEFLQGMMEDDITDYDYLSQRSRCRGRMYGTYQG